LAGEVDGDAEGASPPSAAEDAWFPVAAEEAIEVAVGPAVVIDLAVSQLERREYLSGAEVPVQVIVA
jgi:hypothetical protein